METKAQRFAKPEVDCPLTKWIKRRSGVSRVSVAAPEADTKYPVNFRVSLMTRLKHYSGRLWGSGAQAIQGEGIIGRAMPNDHYMWNLPASKMALRNSAVVALEQYPLYRG